MKKLLLLLLVVLASCDKGEDSEPQVPEYFDVTYEIIGADGIECDSCVTSITYSVSRYEYIEDGINGKSDTKEEYGISIPYSKSIRFKTLSTKEDGVIGNVEISFWVYALEGYVDEIRLYIDGKIVDSENEYPNSRSGYKVPMTVSYPYNTRN